MLGHLRVSKGCLDETQPSLSSLPVSEAPATMLRDEAPWCLDLEASFNSPGQFPHPERACGRYLSRAEDCCSSSSSPFPFGHPCLCELPLSISALLPVNQKLFSLPAEKFPSPMPTQGFGSLQRHCWVRCLYLMNLYWLRGLTLTQHSELHLGSGSQVLRSCPHKALCS